MADYCTLAELKNALGAQTQTYLDADLEQAITAASGAIDQMCNRRFDKDSGDTTRKFLPVSAGFCAVDDLASFTSLTVSSSNWTLDTDFYLEPLNATVQGLPITGIRTIGRPFLFTVKDLDPQTPNFDGRVSVTGTYGWPAVPDEVRQACRILAVRLTKRLREATFGIVSFADMGMRLPSTDPDVAALLSPYQRNFLGV